jgi:chromosome segregation ATPase
MLANDMRRLAEEISTAYEERVKGVAEMRAADAERKRTAQADLKETADQLRADLDKFKSDLDTAEAERKAEDQAEIAERRDYITDLREKAQELVKEFDKAHNEMAKEMRAFLTKFKSDLDAAEAERKSTDQAEIAERRDYINDLGEKAEELLKEFDKAHNEMAKEMRSTLVSFRADLSTTVAGIMGELKKDRLEAARAWNEILSTMRSARGETAIAGPAVVEAKVQVKTVSEAIEEEREEAEPVEDLKAEEEIEEDADEREALRNKIVGLLKENPNGLRMVEIATDLGVENWRSLIPVMRGLHDNGEVRKDDSTYYAV